MNAASTPPVVMPPLSWQRWLLMLGADAVLLALLWYEALSGSTAFALGTWLTAYVTVSAWLRVLRRCWLEWRVQSVFGASISHLPRSALPRAYRGLGALGDGLITATLLWTQQWWLAAAYGMAAALMHYQWWRMARPWPATWTPTGRP